MPEAGTPRLFALPPGVDFPAALVAGLRRRMAGQPPEAMARVDLFLNTGRMRRAVQAAFIAAGPGLLPRLHLVTDLDPLLAGADFPAPVPPLRRRLELAQLVARLLAAQPDLAPRSATFDLAEALAALMEEMQGEGVPPEAIASLDVADHSAHFQRTQAFLAIVAPLFADGASPDAEGLRRRMVETLTRRWHDDPPGHPVIVAGSTGSRGTTALLMQAVARLPQGAVVLPGFDTELPATAWQAMEAAAGAEDHPQFRHLRAARMLGMEPAQILPWEPVTPARPVMNRLISLSLRPAPVTDQWLAEGRSLPDLRDATAHATLIEAPDPRAEALAIALILRQAVEAGRPVSLITPDRMLSRRVTAALDRWRLRPDDSAGERLAMTAPGRLLRQLASMAGERLSAVRLLALIKHPLVASGAGRGQHLLWVRDLELRLRRHGPVFPTGAALRDWAGARRDEGVADWAGWLAGLLDPLAEGGTQPLAGHVAGHRRLAEALAAGPGGAGAGVLWQGAAGEAALRLMEDLATEARHGATMSPRDYASLFDTLAMAAEVREPVQAHPLIRFIGTREARECGAGLVVLAGLNDGAWPRLPDPDPWLNRAMRAAAGLTLPERQIGLSAHDYQQAVAASEVVLTRSLRDAEAETLPSRWLNRLGNLMQGLPSRHGPAALAAMRDRGRVWLDMARALDEPGGRAAPAPRPAPRPPVGARPRELPVTAISRLIRDPYAIYARYILGLQPLAPLMPEADALARGTALHAILDRFIRERSRTDPATERVRLLAVADLVLAEEVPWPAARALWRARLDRASAAFVAREAASDGQPAVIEERGGVDLPGLGFRLTARPDRIDLLPDGRLHILDYKTGKPPSGDAQKHFEKQLLLEAAMAERGGFARLGPREVARISYVGLDATARVEETRIEPAITAEAWQGLCALIGSYARRAQGYASRRAVARVGQAGDYDHLARFGEWQMTDPATPEDVG